MAKRLNFVFLCLLGFGLALVHAAPQGPVTARVELPTELEKREHLLSTYIDKQTCGWYSGNTDAPRIAKAGSTCRLAIDRSMWGDCATSIPATAGIGKCNWFYGCYDNYNCKKGCGKTNNADLWTLNCQKSQHCQFAVLTIESNGPEFTSMTCAQDGTTQHLTTTSNPLLHTRPHTGSGSGSLATQTASSGASETSAAETAASSSQPKEPGGSGANSNTGPIVGGVLGGLALICGTAVAVVAILRRNKKKDDEDGDGEAKDDGSQTDLAKGHVDLSTPQEMASDISSPMSGLTSELSAVDKPAELSGKGSAVEIAGKQKLAELAGMPKSAIPRDPVELEG